MSYYKFDVDSEGRIIGMYIYCPEDSKKYKITIASGGELTTTEVS